jgi:metal-responsive CopG/Arc/MetJ family transcriptional regulator
MKTENQVRSNRKSSSRRSQAENPSRAGRRGAPALAVGRNPGSNSQFKTIRVYFPSAIVPLIDQAAAMEGESREEFILNAVQEKIDRGATVKTIWISLPDRLIAMLDSVCEKEGESRQELFERIIREQLPAIERRAGQGTAVAAASPAGAEAGGGATAGPAMPVKRPLSKREQFQAFVLVGIFAQDLACKSDDAPVVMHMAGQIPEEQIPDDVTAAAHAFLGFCNGVRKKPDDWMIGQTRHRGLARHE